MNNLFLLLIILVPLLLLFLFKKKFNRHAINQKKAYRVLKQIKTFKHAGQKINYLRKIDPFVFEELLLNVYESKGFKIIRNKKYTGDGGNDGTMFDHEGNKILIQAKRYKSYINPKHIKSFEELLNKRNISRGFFIHTGKSSQNTRNLFNDSNVTIIGGSALVQLIENSN